MRASQFLQRLRHSTSMRSMGTAVPQKHHQLYPSLAKSTASVNRLPLPATQMYQ
jgi:hypothetical protein